MKSSVYLVLVVSAIAFAPGNANVIRNQSKRSIDLVLRSVADVFGYDILKRPSVLPTTPPPAVSTFPPPLAKLPPVPPPKTPPQKPPAPAPAPLPPKLPPPPAPAPPPKAAPPPLPPLPLLTEGIQKSFSINFNWNRNVGTPAPPPPPPKPPQATLQPLKPSPVPPPKQTNHQKPQLYQDYEYNSNVEPNENLYDYDAPAKPLHQKEEQNYADYSSVDYSETTKQFSKKPLNDLTESKQKFKSSVNEFWKTYPLTEQKGYKYITPQENQHEPSELSKYEEYELMKKVEDEEECPPIKSHLAKVKSGETSRINKKQRNEVRKKDHSRMRHSNKQITANKSNVISSADSISHPLYISLFPKQLHELVEAESRSKPWPIPFDHEIDGTEDTETVIKPKGFSIIVDNNCCYGKPEKVKRHTISDLLFQ